VDIQEEMIMEKNVTFSQYLEGIGLYRDVMKIVRMQCDGGRVFLIGSVVYKTLSYVLHGSPKLEFKDFDVLCERRFPVERLIVPQGWSMQKTSLGEPRFVRGDGLVIDVVRLTESVSWSDRGRAMQMSTVELLESYLRRAPLTVQSIAYDVDSRELFGQVGLRAIRTKKIGVNCFDEMVKYCSRHRPLTNGEFLNRKLEEMDYLYDPDTK